MHHVKFMVHNCDNSFIASPQKAKCNQFNISCLFDFFNADIITSILLTIKYVTSRCKTKLLFY